MEIVHFLSEKDMYPTIYNLFAEIKNLFQISTFENVRTFENTIAFL